MARCGCGSVCGCALQAGTGTTVTGSGTPANPWIVSSVVNCADVRTCLSAQNSATYNPTTGVIGVCLSTDAGNTITRGADGCLFVPSGNNSVVTGCGITGTGLPASPLRANTVTPPVGCPESEFTDVYCRADGTLAGQPERVHATMEGSAFVGSNTINNLAPADGSFHTIATTTGTIVNPSACYSMRVQLRAGISHAQYVPRGPGDNQIEVGTAVTFSGSIVGPQPLVAHQNWRIEDQPAGGRATFDSAGSYDFVYFTLPPGGSVTVQLDGMLFNAGSVATSELNTPRWKMYAEGFSI